MTEITNNPTRFAGPDVFALRVQHSTLVESWRQGLIERDDLLGWVADRTTEELGALIKGYELFPLPVGRG